METKLTSRIPIFLGVSLVALAVGCAPLSRPVTEREQSTAIGGLTGGATGAVIGSFAGSAVTGGLFGMPIGAVAGYYIGDRLAQAERTTESQIRERDTEIDRLRRENERLRLKDREASNRQQQQEDRSRDLAAAERGSEPSRIAERSRVFAEQELSPTQERRAQLEQVRQAQKRLNDMGFHAGPVDGIIGPITQSALRNFQESKGLEPTGRLSDETKKALDIKESGRSNQ